MANLSKAKRERLLTVLDEIRSGLKDTRQIEKLGEMIFAHVAVK